MVFLHLKSVCPKLFVLLWVTGKHAWCCVVKCVQRDLFFSTEPMKTLQISKWGCTNLVNGNGTIIASSAMASGFGHSIDHTAPLGAHETWYSMENRSWKRSDDVYNETRWWFQICFIFIPTWGDDPIWRAYFSNGKVPLTKQQSSRCVVPSFGKLLFKTRTTGHRVTCQDQISCHITSWEKLCYLCWDPLRGDSIRDQTWFLSWRSRITIERFTTITYIPDAQWGWPIYLQTWVVLGVNVTVNIPAPLSIRDNHPKKVTITQVIATLYIFAPTLDHSQPNRLGHKKTWIAAGWVNFVDQQKCSNKQLTSGTRLIDSIIQF